MKLSEIEIVSYRSIVNQKITITDRCIGLIGLNESGKSNVLNSIRSLDSTTNFTIKDQSKINDELPRVKFEFLFDENDNIEFTEEFKQYISGFKILPESEIVSQITITNCIITKYLFKEKAEYKNNRSYNCNFTFTAKSDFMRIKTGAIIPDEEIITVNDVEHIFKQTLACKERINPTISN